MAKTDTLAAVKSRHSAALRKMPGVCGVDADLDAQAIVLHLDSDDPDVRKALPTALEGYPVECVVDGPYEKQ